MLDYCPKQGKQNSQHKAHARRATRTRAPSAKRRTPTPRSGTNHRATRRYNLAYTRLHDLVAKASSKSHSAFLRPLGSRFTGTSATYPDGLPRLTVPPRAFNVSGALPANRILTAKFASQSMDRLQAPQLNTHSLRGSLAFATPQHAPTRTHIQPFCPPSTSRETRTHTPNRAAHFECAMSTYSLTLPQYLPSRDSCELGLLKPRHKTRVQRLPILSRLPPIVGRFPSRPLTRCRGPR